MSVINLKLA